MIASATIRTSVRWLLNGLPSAQRTAANQRPHQETQRVRKRREGRAEVTTGAAVCFNDELAARSAKCLSGASPWDSSLNFIERVLPR